MHLRLTNELEHFEDAFHKDALLVGVLTVAILLLAANHRSWARKNVTFFGLASLESSPAALALSNCSRLGSPRVTI